MPSSPPWLPQTAPVQALPSLLLDRTDNTKPGTPTARLWEGSGEGAEFEFGAAGQEEPGDEGPHRGPGVRFLGCLVLGGKKSRQFNFTATATPESDTVKLTEHDAHLWADLTEQERVSSAVRSVLATWGEEAA